MENEVEVQRETLEKTTEANDKTQVTDVDMENVSGVRPMETPKKIDGVDEAAGSTTQVVDINMIEAGVGLIEIPEITASDDEAINKTLAADIDMEFEACIGPVETPAKNNSNDKSSDKTKLADIDMKKDAGVGPINTPEKTNGDNTNGKFQVSVIEIDKQTDDTITDSPPVEFTILHNKNEYKISMPLSSTINQLKEKLETTIYVSKQMQKILIKGLAKNDQTLESLNVTSSSKIMVVGAKLRDVLATSAASVELATETDTSSFDKVPLCKQKKHLKVLERGKPHDAMFAILNFKDHLPLQSLSGILDEHGLKIRLTFKLERDELWIVSKDTTLKLNMENIKNVVSEPIEGHDEYYIIGLQVGNSGKKINSNFYWVYWIPAQYVDSIKKTILNI